MAKTADSVETRAELSEFIRELRQSLANEPASWENNDLPSFLEAMAAWIDDMEGFDRNSQEPVPELSPDWRLLAQILSAARVYE